MLVVISKIKNVATLRWEHCIFHNYAISPTQGLLQYQICIIMSLIGTKPYIQGKGVHRM